MQYITEVFRAQFKLVVNGTEEESDEQGHASAQNNLAVHYEDRIGVEKDEQAVELYRKAAEQGVADAQFNLAVCYKNGTGVEKDEQQAVEWYRKAADQGHAVAQLILAIMELE